MAADNSDDDNEKVGKCKPPVHSRWKPGQCGNPRGRPKGALNLKTYFKGMLEASVTVNDKGKPKRMTTLKAVIWRVREGALKGNHRSMNIVLEQAARIYDSPASEPLGDISKDDRAILDAYREEIRAETTKHNSGSRGDNSEDSK
jgi:Family of unknown function (DUF5681)